MKTAFGALVPAGLGLTSLAAYGEDGGFALLGRAYDPVRGVRLYLVSDDNGSPTQRTDLLAFDWQPAPEKRTVS